MPKSAAVEGSRDELSAENACDNEADIDIPVPRRRKRVAPPAKGIKKRCFHSDPLSITGSQVQWCASCGAARFAADRKSKVRWHAPKASKKKGGKPARKKPALRPAVSKGKSRRVARKPAPIALVAP